MAISLCSFSSRAGDEQHHEHADHRQERAEGEQVVVADESMESLLDVQDDEHDAADHGAAEQQRAVLVDLAGLDGLQRVAAFRCQ